jgi:hypothetical protein
MNHRIAELKSTLTNHQETNRELEHKLSCFLFLSVILVEESTHTRLKCHIKILLKLQFYGMLMLLLE